MASTQEGPVHRTPAEPRWNPQLTVALLVLLAVVGMYWDSARTLIGVWTNEGAYGHGLLLLPICCYLIWQARFDLGRLGTQPSVLGVAVLGAAVALWWLARLVDIQVVQQVALLLMVTGGLWSLLGTRSVKRLAFPLAYLWLGIPLWGPLEPVLQNLTVTMVSLALRLSGVPVFVEASDITIPEGRFSVEEVCAGMRYVLAALAIASLFAYIHAFPFKKFAGFVFVALGLAVFTNWVRVYVVIMAGHWTDMQHSLVHAHVEFGWWLFAAVLLPIFWLGRRIAGRMPEPTAPANTNAVKINTRRLAWVLALDVAIVVAAPVSADVLKRVDDAAPVALLWPQVAPGWQGPEPASGPWQPVFTGANAELLGRFHKDDSSVWLYLAYYGEQYQGHELIHYLNSTVAGLDAARVNTRVYTVSLPVPMEVVESDVVSARGEHWLVWHRYYVGAGDTARPPIAKLLQVWDMIGPRQGAAVVAMAASYREESEEARRVLATFVAGLGVAGGQGAGQFLAP